MGMFLKTYFIIRNHLFPQYITIIYACVKACVKHARVSVQNVCHKMRLKQLIQSIRFQKNK